MALPPHRGWLSPWPRKRVLCRVLAKICWGHCMFRNGQTSVNSPQNQSYLTFALSRLCSSSKTDDQGERERLGRNVKEDADSIYACFFISSLILQQILITCQALVGWVSEWIQRGSGLRELQIKPWWTNWNTTCVTCFTHTHSLTHAHTVPELCPENSTGRASWFGRHISWTIRTSRSDKNIPGTIHVNLLLSEKHF